jgi:hypothetical protein
MRSLINIPEPGNYFSQKNLYNLKVQAIWDRGKGCLWLSTGHKGASHDSWLLYMEWNKTEWLHSWIERDPQAARSIVGWQLCTSHICTHFNTIWQFTTKLSWRCSQILAFQLQNNKQVSTLGNNHVIWFVQKTTTVSSYDQQHCGIIFWLMSKRTKTFAKWDMTLMQIMKVSLSMRQVECFGFPW